MSPGMLPWYLRDTARLEHERRAVAGLETGADWLVGCEWSWDDGLGITAVLRVSDRDYQLRLTYPALFPSVPPVVRPVGEEQRLSGHQYGGSDGPLCLEWGPDNWHPGLTAADMLQSAHDLLAAERPAQHTQGWERMDAPSRHHLTPGQSLRGESLRWYASDALLQFLAGCSPSSRGPLHTSLQNLKSSYACLVHRLEAATGDVLWSDRSIPAELPGGSPRQTGVWIRTELEPGLITTVKTLDALRSMLRSAGENVGMLDGGALPGLMLRSVLIMDRSESACLYLVTEDGEFLSCMPVMSESTGGTQRAPDLPALANRSAAIVGLGSAGSKIALSLARMGVGRFYLVDHDVLLPGNLRRHALDWQSVTQHKADAVARAVRFIDPLITVETSKIHLTGQESNAAVGAVLSDLAHCDVLVDATAEPRVFNLLSATAEASARPLVWLEVFAGGIGGLVARSRPGADPTPQDMRAAFHHFCTLNPAPEALRAATRYVTDAGVGEPIAATDPDVGVIAHHTARLIADTLHPSAESVFPHSLYLVGLKRSWVFEAPFATIPIDLGAIPRSAATPRVDATFSPDALQFLTSLLPREGSS